jgi:hypothetical protein
MKNCENIAGRILRPGCYDGKGLILVTVVYHKNPFDKSGETSDALRLCGDCAPRISRDAEGHGYETRQKAI